LAAYVGGTHHPQHALALRAVYVAVSGRSVVGYIAGHLTRRHACDGEVQYLWVAPQHRRQGIATELLRQLGEWFAAQRASKVCVNVAEDNVVAQRFFRGCGAGDLERHWLVWVDIRGAA
jgi:ribosomal protein S18 acetylase RimI-like enzyme